MTVYFIGAGPGDPDLLTVKGLRILAACEVVIYAGSLVNPALLEHCRSDAKIYNSAQMTLEEIIAEMEEAHQAGQRVARLHTGDPSLYGAIQEQMDALARRSIPFTLIPGVSSFTAAAAALEREYTQPGGSQTLILTRLEGRTPVPSREKLSRLASHQASMCIFLSVHLLDQVTEELLTHYPPQTPAAVVYKASWPEERVLKGTLAELPRLVQEEGIARTALILVGEFLAGSSSRSLLYDGTFSHDCREGQR